LAPTVVQDIFNKHLVVLLSHAQQLQATYTTSQFLQSDF